MRLCRDRLKGGLPTHRTVYLSFVICVIIKNIFLLAGFLEPIMTSAALKSLSAVGNILIFLCRHEPLWAASRAHC